MEGVLNVGLPVFATVLTGYVCGWLGIFGALAAEALNSFVFFGWLFRR